MTSKIPDHIREELEADGVEVRDASEMPEEMKQEAINLILKNGIQMSPEARKGMEENGLTVEMVEAMILKELGNKPS